METANLRNCVRELGEKWVAAEHERFATSQRVRNRRAVQLLAVVYRVWTLSFTLNVKQCVHDGLT